MSMWGKLVYDGDTGQLVYDDSTGKLVYADTLKLVYGEQANDRKYEKVGSDAVLEDAIDEMEAAAWSQVAEVSVIQPLCQLLVGVYGVQAKCIRYDIAARDAVGGTITQIDVDFSWVVGTQTWRVGLQTNNTGVPDDDWTWVTGATGGTGTGDGAQSIAVTITLQDYLFVLLSFDPYAEPPGDGTPDLARITEADGSAEHRLFD